MECPYCGYENLEGADECGRCCADLRFLLGTSAQGNIETDLLRRPLADVVTHDYITVSPGTLVGEVVRQLDHVGMHCALVVDHGRLVGIFTERDALYKVAHDAARLADHPVREVMTFNPESLEHDVPIVFALNRMVVGGYRHLPITRDGKLLGLISVRDILGYLTRQFSDVLGAPALT